MVMACESVTEAGEYTLALLYSAHANRSSRAKVIVAIDGEAQTLTVNQREPVLVDGKPRVLGVLTLPAGRGTAITVSNEGSDGIVSVDGLQLVPQPSDPDTS